MPFVTSENVYTQVEDALTALGYTDIEITRRGTTYTAVANNEDGYRETIPFDSTDPGTAIYKLIVDDELVEYFVGGQNSETVAPASGAGVGTGYVYSLDNGSKWDYVANNGQAYNGAQSVDVMIKTEYVDVTATTISAPDGWSGSIDPAMPDYLTAGDKFDVVVTRNSATAYDEDKFNDYTWTVTAGDAVLDYEAELTTEGTDSDEPVVTIHVTVKSVDEDITTMAATAAAKEA